MNYQIAFYASITYILLSVVYAIWNINKINKLSKASEETSKLLSTMTSHITANSEMIETLGEYSDTYSEAIVKLADNQEKIVGLFHLLVEKMETKPKSTEASPQTETKSKGRRK